MLLPWKYLIYFHQFVLIFFYIVHDLQNEDVRSYIGKYKIKKDKIISGNGYHKEFICNYEDVEMISYEVVDIKKIMTHRGIHDDAEDIDWRTH